MFKTSFRLAAIGAALAAVSLSSNLFAGDQDFTLHNKTGVEIHQLFVSPHSTNEWEEDILGQATLEDGSELEISFSPKEDAELWDLKIVDKAGDSVVWENLKLTQITDVILEIKDGEAIASTKNGD